MRPGRASTLGTSALVLVAVASGAAACVPGYEPLAGDTSDVGTASTGAGTQGSSTTASTSASSSASAGTSGSTSGGTSSSGSTGGVGGCPSDAILIVGGSFTDVGSGPKTLHTLDDACLGRHEVTVDEYKQCVLAGSCTVPSGSAAPTYNYSATDRGDHPVNGVTAQQAADYCTWNGGFLPDEWTWEWAARGRSAARTYPWGDTAPTCSAVVFGLSSSLECAASAPYGTRPVGTGSPAGDTIDGLQNMAGNVWEWTSSLWDPAQVDRVERGGGWGTPAQFIATTHRTAHIAAGTHTNEFTGFRCAYSPG